jgi:hypothetical protein
MFCYISTAAMVTRTRQNVTLYEYYLSLYNDSLMFSWSDHVKTEEVLQRVKEELNILSIIKIRKVTRLATSCVGTDF